MSRESDFIAANLRMPTREEAKELAALEAEDQRKRESERYERDVRRAYMTTPGADEAGWQRDRAEVLAESRKADTLRQREEARRSQAALYRSF